MLLQKNRLISSNGNTTTISQNNIFGQNISNPIAAIWSGAMMLEFLGNGDDAFDQASQDIMQAIEYVLLNGPKTPDVGGTAKTNDVGDAIVSWIQEN